MSKLPGQTPFQPVGVFLTFWAELHSLELGWSTSHPVGPLSVDLLALHIQPDVPEQHQGHARYSDLPPTHKPPFVEQPVDHLLPDPAANPGEKLGVPYALARVNLLASDGLLRQQVTDFRHTSPFQKVFPRKAPTSPTTGAAGFYRLSNLCLKKMATGK